MINGAECYRKYLDGDNNAFDLIINEYRECLTMFVFRYVGEIAAAEDIAIDTFTELIVNKKRYNFKTQLKTYLFMVGRSKAIDYIRHRDRYKMVEYEQCEAELVSSDRPEDNLISDERKKTVKEAVEKLPKDMQAVIHLIYYEDLSYEEAAKVMKKSRKQVDNLLYRAKRKLKEILGEEGEQLL